MGTGRPCSSKLRRSIMPYRVAMRRSRSHSSGKDTRKPVICSTSESQRAWVSRELVESASSLQSRRANSSCNAAKAPSSVVQMGVKSPGWEKKRHHESPT